MVDVNGASIPISDDEVIDAALQILSQRVVRANALNNPRAVREYLAVRFAGLEHEVFTCLYCFGARSTARACIRARW